MFTDFNFIEYLRNAKLYLCRRSKMVWYISLFLGGPNSYPWLPHLVIDLLQPFYGNNNERKFTTNQRAMITTTTRLWSMAITTSQQNQTAHLTCVPRELTYWTEGGAAEFDIGLLRENTSQIQRALLTFYHTHVLQLVVGPICRESTTNPSPSVSLFFAVLDRSSARLAIPSRSHSYLRAPLMRKTLRDRYDVVFALRSTRSTSFA